MTAGIKIKKKELEEALRKTHGNYQLSAKMLKVTREGVRKCVKRYPDLEEIVKEEREGIVDIAEGALQTAVLNGEAWAIQFTLRNLGRQRGYFEKFQQELTNAEGQAFKITMSHEEIRKKAREILDRYE